MKKITAKFASDCAETGKRILRGEVMYYDYLTRQCYCMASKKAKAIEDKECTDTANYIQAQEDAYFDNFCANDRNY